MDNKDQYQEQKQGQEPKKTNKQKPLLLIIDDESSICESLSGVASDEGWDCCTSLSGREGLSMYQKLAPDLVLLDVWMEGMDGVETLQRLKDIDTYTPIVIMSGHANIETAVKTTKFGAFDFLEKPLSLEKLLPIFDYAIELKQKRQAFDRSEYPEDSKFKNISYEKNNLDLIGQSEAMESIKEQIKLVAPRNSWVLISGENGTGKEILAHKIHACSHRSKNSFVAINCAAIPEELIESELFGYEKGAFSGAYTQKKGKFELADKGTLFLDEIGDMSLKTQAKILRILQEQKFERVGGKDTITVDVRVIAATNQDLHRAMEEGRFREDLYYRLNVIPFFMPPLRDRKSDIKLLVSYFLKKYSLDLNEEQKDLSKEAMLVLEAYPWPGNVRELKNLMERLCIMVSSKVIDVEDLPSYITSSTKKLYKDLGTFVDLESSKDNVYSLKQAREDFEKNFILTKLQENDWNVTKTAELIGIDRSSLHKKLKSYGLDLKDLKG